MARTVLSLALCSVVAFGLAACQRAESPGQADSGVDAPAFQSDATQAMAEGGGTGANVDQAASHDESGVVYEAAQARHDEAIAAAQGRLDTALQRCESMQGGAQSSCQQTAQSAFAADKETAELALEVARRRADYINRD
jgi:hypothetical protein